MVYLELWNSVYSFQRSQHSQHPEGLYGVQVLSSTDAIPINTGGGVRGFRWYPRVGGNMLADSMYQP